MKVQIGEVDLRQPVHSCYVDRRFQRVTLLVRWGGIPIGMVNFPVGGGDRVVTPGQLSSAIGQVLGYRIWELKVSGEFFDLTAGSKPPISVIVCSRDRPLSLAQCLDSIKRIDYPEFEVIVVDNASRADSTREVVLRAGFHYLREDRAGLNWARNCGVRASRYPIVAFIDDDALASPGWLAGFARAFQDPSVIVATGLVMPSELETAAQQAFEEYGGMGKGFEGFTVRPEDLSRQALFWASSWGVGANMAFRREIFDKIGMFDVALDVGTPTGGGGDIEFFYRALDSGFALRYEPCAYVWHRHRRTMSALRKQIYFNGRSFPAYLLTILHNDPRKVWAVTWFGLRGWLWGWLGKQLLKGLIQRNSRVIQFAFLEMKGALTSLPAYRAARSKASRLQAS